MKKSTAQLLRRASQPSKTHLLIFVVTFATIGAYIILQSSAASGMANIFVAGSGNSSCTRSATTLSFSGATGHICSTPAQACNIAASADIVIIEDGTYSGNFTSCHGHQSYASNVVMQPEPGHECPNSYPAIPGPFTDTSCNVRFTGTAINGGNNRNCDLTSGMGNPLPSTLSAAQKANWINHLTIRGIYVGGFGITCAAEIRLENDVGAAFYIRQGSYNVTIDGGAYANETDGSDPTVGDSTVAPNGSDPGGTSWPPAENVTLQNSVYHDLTTNDPGSHGDGIFVQPSYNTKIIKNILARDDCIPIYVNYAVWSSIGVHGLWVIGNVVHVDTQHVANTGHCSQGISLGDNVQSDTIVAFNSLETPIRRSPTTNNTTNDQVVGNITDGVSGFSGYGCVSGLSAKYNVFTDSSAVNCGDSTNTLTNGASQFISTDTQPNSPTNSDPMFTAPLGNYQLKSGSVAIGKVPLSWCTANPGVCPTTDINGNTRPNPSHPSFYDAGAYEFGSSGGSGDTTPPTVSLTAPSNNASVSGSVSVSASASDNVAVAGVQFRLDGSNLGAEDTSAPYTTSWDATQAQNGSHTLTAVARDAAGNTTTSSPISVSVTGGTNSFKIGETNILGSADDSNGNLLLAQSTTLSQTATIQSLSFYVTTASGNLRLGIYDASGPGGGPGTLKAQTASFTPVTGWNTADTTTNPTLSPGTYWLAYLPSSNSLAFVKADDSSSSGVLYSYTYAALPNTFSTSPSTTSSHWSLYATLTLSGASSKQGDLNNDGAVNILDLSILLSNYATSNAIADINKDGTVNILDLSILLSNYGT
jgi:hypothetical protein